jgi:hypothetical protein
MPCCGRPKHFYSARTTASPHGGIAGRIGKSEDADFVGAMTVASSASRGLAPPTTPLAV